MQDGFRTIDEALEYLDRIGTQDDADIDLFEGALALSAQNHPGVSLDKYRNHRIKLVEDVQAIHAAYIAAGNADDVHAKIHAIAETFTRKHGYIGDDFRYNDLQNADLIRVIDRRLGLPIALSLLCVTMGRDVGWPVVGINFPAHYVIRLEEGGVRQIVDPFQGCIVLDAPDLREILKTTMGPKAELSATYYEPATNRDTLVRLQNNIKLRQIESEDYHSALATVDLMKRVAPDEYRLDLDAGVLLSRVERPAAAIEALERYVAKVPNAKDKHDATVLLQQLKGSLQ
jgi:regulator of sirC expression with transglutaminase-like and TPR domain